MLSGEHRPQSLVSSLDNLHIEKTVGGLQDEFKTAGSSGDIEKLIDKIDATVESIDRGMRLYVQISQRSHQQEIGSVELGRAKLSTTISSSNDLTRLLSKANDLGHPLTFKIKTLDEEIQNVKKTLTFVTDIQLLRKNINQAHFAMEHKDWETAVQCISTIRTRLLDDLKNGKFASVVIPSTDIPELPSVTLANWVEILTDVFQKEFNEAASSKDVPNLTKYFQMFPLILQEEVGLNCYSKFICQIIIDTLRTLITSACKGDASSTRPGLYSTISIQLFESISTMLSQHGPLIKKYYSQTYKDALTYVVTKIQHEIDSQIGVITDTFYDVKRIDKMLQDISQYSFPLLTRRLKELQDQAASEPTTPFDTFDSDIISVVDVGDLIGELASILHNWGLYVKFITIQYYSKPQSEKSEEGLTIPQIIAKSTFTDKITKKYLPAFESLYLFYIRRSLEKAISTEELPSLSPFLKNTNVLNSPDQVPCSSVIEDATLVMHSTLRNAIDTSQASTVRKFIIESYKIIQRDLINGFFIKNLNENQPRYNSSLVLEDNSENGAYQGVSASTISRTGTPVQDGSTSTMGFFKGATNALGNVVGSGASTVSATISTGSNANNTKLLNFVLYLNSVAIGQEYFEKIIKNLLNGDHNSLRSGFAFGKDQEMVETLMVSEFLEPFLSSTKRIIQDSLIHFYNQSLKLKLVALVNDTFPDISESNYIIYSSSNLNDTSAILKFTSTWQSLIRPYRQVFHKGLIFSKLMRLLVVNLANLIERRLFAVLKKFKINDLGSIKLEKDLSYLINEVCEDNYELKEKFVRVTQLVLIVCMDEEEYELDGGGIREDVELDDESSGINWVLTPQERKLARRFRI